MKASASKRIFLPICVFTAEGGTNVRGWALYDCSQKQAFPRLFASRKEALAAAGRAAGDPLMARPPSLDAMFEGLSSEFWPRPLGGQHRVVATTGHPSGPHWRGRAVGNALRYLESEVAYRAERCVALLGAVLVIAGALLGICSCLGFAGAVPGVFALAGLGVFVRLAFETSELISAVHDRRRSGNLPLGRTGGDPRLN